MKKISGQKTQFRRVGPSWIPLEQKERKVFLTAVQQLDEHCDRWGFLDPTDLEIALIYSPQEAER